MAQFTDETSEHFISPLGSVNWQHRFRLHDFRLVFVGLLKGEFSKQFISHIRPVNWPIGYRLKVNVYKDKLATFEAVRAIVDEFINAILGYVLKRVYHNWIERIKHLMCNIDQFFHEILGDILNRVCQKSFDVWTYGFKYVKNMIIWIQIIHKFL